MRLTLVCGLIGLLSFVNSVGLAREFAVTEAPPLRLPAGDSDVTELFIPELSTHSLSLSPDGRRLAVFDLDGDLLLWDLQTGAGVSIRDLFETSFERSGTHLRFSQDSTKLFAGGETVLALVPVDNPGHLTWFPAEFTPKNSAPLAGVSLSVSPAGSYVVTRSELKKRDRTGGFKVWNTKTREAILSSDTTDYPSIVFSPDEKLAACIGVVPDRHKYNNSLWIIDLENRRVLEPIEGVSKPDPGSLRFSPDSKRVLVTTPAGLLAYNVERHGALTFAGRLQKEVTDGLSSGRSKDYLRFEHVSWLDASNTVLVPMRLELFSWRIDSPQPLRFGVAAYPDISAPPILCGEGKKMVTVHGKYDVERVMVTMLDDPRPYSVISLPTSVRGCRVNQFAVRSDGAYLVAARDKCIAIQRINKAPAATSGKVAVNATGALKKFLELDVSARVERSDRPGAIVRSDDVDGISGDGAFLVLHHDGSSARWILDLRNEQKVHQLKFSGNRSDTIPPPSGFFSRVQSLSYGNMVSFEEEPHLLFAGDRGFEMVMIDLKRRCFQIVDRQSLQVRGRSNYSAARYFKKSSFCAARSFKSGMALAIISDNDKCALYYFTDPTRLPAPFYQYDNYRLRLPVLPSFLSISGSGKYVAMDTLAKAVKVWNMTKAPPEEIANPIVPDDDVSAWYDMGFIDGPKELLCVVDGKRKTIQVFDPESRTIRETTLRKETLVGRPSEFIINRPSASCAMLTSEGELAVFSLPDGEIVAKDSLAGPGDGSSMRKLFWSADGKVLVFKGSRTLRAWTFQK